jgi:hypothetical protein
MSLAVWEMYGSGRESVVIRSTRSKLEALLEQHAPFLEQRGLKGGVADVEYLEGLKNPDEGVQERIHQILFEKEQDLELGLFTIKPSIFDFEQEVRGIIHPKLICLRLILSCFIERAHHIGGRDSGRGTGVFKRGCTTVAVINPHFLEDACSHC